MDEDDGWAVRASASSLKVATDDVPLGPAHATEPVTVSLPKGAAGPASSWQTIVLVAVLSSAITGVASFVAFRWSAPGAPVAVSSPFPQPSGSTAVAAGTSPVPVASPNPPSPLPTATSPVVPASVAPASSLVAMIARALPSLVTITVSTVTGFGSRRATGEGSGFVFDRHGWILTNAHVVAGADTLMVRFADGRELSGQVYGVASSTDLAVVRVAATDLEALALGHSSGLAVGESVVAIGDPLGLYPGSATTGIVSGLERSVDFGDSGVLSGLIQTDAAINPGDSGGPLLDLAGRVIGVDTATSGSAQGISFAIPIDVAMPILAAALAGSPIP
ncbi:MAG: trypsin-like peptidase domain-containing protein [Candidatus Limnocylindrales bacterium]